MVCVYKDTLPKDNKADIWPKPTLLDFGPFLYKDNMEKSKDTFFRKFLTREQKKRFFIFLEKLWCLKLWLIFLALLCYF